MKKINSEFKNGDKKYSLSHKIYLNLKKAITYRILLPNTRLNEAELCEIYNTSRTPVRSALQKLEYEGLVKCYPKKGYFIYSPTIEEISQLFFIRKNLEGLASEVAASLISDKQIEKLEYLLDVEVNKFKNNDPWGVIENSTSFHKLIAEVSNNKWLIKYIRNLLDQSTTILLFYDPFNPESPRSPEEHCSIVKALRERNPAGAKKSMMRHLESIEKNLRLDELIPTGVQSLKNHFNID